MPSESDSQKPVADIALCSTHLASEGDGDEKNANAPVVSPGDCKLCKAETRKRRVYRWKLVGALVTPFFVGNVDLMIVSPAFPQIASHFGQSHEEQQPALRLSISF
jgi:hypothetical protein